MNDIIITNSFYFKEDKKYGIDGQTFSIPFNKPFTKGNIIHNGFDNCPKLFVDNIESFDSIHHCFVHNVQVVSNKNQYYERKYLFPGTRFFTVPTVDDSRPLFASTSLVDALKPVQLLFNRRMAGEKLTTTENAILDAGFPVQQARNEFIKALDEYESKMYFTPAIEDIKVGYECEKIGHGEFDTHFDIFLKEDATKEDYAKAWNDYYTSNRVQSSGYVLTAKDVIDILKFTGDLRSSPGIPIRGFFRTRYLTPDQIEKEGWTNTTHPLNYGYYTFTKQHIYTNKIRGVNFDYSIPVELSLSYNFISKVLIVNYDGGEFAGINHLDCICRDINTFRQLMKQL